MNKKSVIIVFQIIILSIVSCEAISRTSSNEDSIFTNNVGNYSIKYPSGWKAMELPYGRGADDYATGLIMKPIPGYPIVDISQKTAKQPTMDEIVKWGEERISLRYNDQDEVNDYQLDDLVVLNESELQMAKRTYLITFNDKNYEPLKKEDVYIIIGQEMFIITYSAPVSDFDSYYETFQNMIQSFRLVEN